MNIGFDAKRIFHNCTGLGNYSRDFIRVLSSHFPEHNYFLYNPKKGNVQNFVLPENTIEIQPIKKIDKLFSSYWREKSMVKKLLENDIQIYHGLSNELPIGIEKTNIKTVVTIHDLIFLRYPNLYPLFDRKNFKRKFKNACEIADIIIAISEQTKRDIVDFFNIPEHKIVICYQGCNAVFKKFYNKSFKNEVLKKYNLPKDFILNVGTIEERKNLLTIVKAIKNIDIPLVVLGNKRSYFKKVTQYIKQNNLQKKVIFLERLTMEELACLYQLTKIFVYPSVFEGFGIPIIEALYSKTPVIGAKGSCLEEAGGVYSEYISPYKSEELAHKINVILKDQTKRDQMTNKGFEYVQRFNDENIAKSIIQVYEQIR